MDDEKNKKKAGRTGMTRRGFMGNIGVGAVTVGVMAGSTGKTEAKEMETAKAGQMKKTSLMVNGRRHAVMVEPRWTLLYVLRDVLGLTATKEGCNRGECGACTVLIDGVPRYACMTLALEAEGTQIVTLEGVMDGEKLDVVQEAFLEHDGYQCGYCTPGQIMAAEGLLQQNPAPSFDEIRVGMSGNLCRCGAYRNIFAAVSDAAQKLGK